MTGLLYKEIRQFWYVLLAAALLPVLLLWAPFLAVANEGDSFADVIRRFCSFSLVPVMVLVSYLMIGLAESAIFNDDEQKKWCFFTLSHPKGGSGQVYMKYIFILMTSGLLTVSVLFQWSLLDTVCYTVTGTETQPPDFSMLVMLFFIQIFLRATDIPFYVRFGVQRGTTIKVISVLALIYLGMIYLLFGPLPDSMYLDITGFLEKLRSGEYGERILVCINLIPFVAMAAYYASYKISCRVYRKGAQEYE